VAKNTARAENTLGGARTAFTDKRVAHIKSQILELTPPAVCYLVFIGPALAVALVDWFGSRLSVIPGAVAPTLFAYGAAVLAVAWAGTRDVWVLGLVGGIPA